ncbi:hypothetical protein [Rhizobium sp. L9]|uniref:hypothetical protein n=1 Tax=Rhizobium sp. L9 TaxID=1340738 RepID=UPI0015964E7A|nr:hypothetical protein [Rhizobium sp. L9]
MKEFFLQFSISRTFNPVLQGSGAKPAEINLIICGHYDDLAAAPHPPAGTFLDKKNVGY